MSQKAHGVKRPSILGYGRQWITDDDIAAVVATLKDTNLTQGPRVAAFERAVAEYCGAKYAVSCTSATAGLHMACLAAGMKPGDEGITSPITFVATANAVHYAGATPVFADVIEDTALIDPDQVAAKLSAKTRAVLPVHYAGQSCDMERIAAAVASATQKHGRKIYVIEDAAHALGATYRDSRVGSCKYSDMTVMSFHPVKHITTGEGGVVLTNDAELYRRLTLLRSHGVTRDADLIESDQFLPWGYEQVELGFNYRLTDIQCALGITQMARLPEFVRRRREIVARYRREFADTPALKLIPEQKYGEGSWHLMVIRADFDRLGGRTAFMGRLFELGMVTQVMYIPVHTQPYHRRQLGTQWGDFPRAEAFFKSCLSIPLFPAMTDDDVTWVIAEIKGAVGARQLG